MSADHLGELDLVAHRRGDQDLAALVVVGDHGRHVGHVAAVILEIEAAGADHPPRESDAHRGDQVGELVDEEVGVHAAAEIPVAPPLGVLGRLNGISGARPKSVPRNIFQLTVRGFMSFVNL